MRFKFMIIATAAFTLMFSNTSFAGSASGKVLQLAPTSAMFTFVLSTFSTGAPACATVTNHFAIDVSTTQGQSLAAALMVAFSSGYTVDIVGTNSCNAGQANEEQISFIVVHSPGN
jgi:hypothetical protein